jgi:hypothetical protein
MADELRYRYRDRNGRAIWLAFDPGFACILLTRLSVRGGFA